MPPRIDERNVSPLVFKAMMSLETAVHSLGIDPLLLDLIKLRASQINGCAYCIDMHSKEAKHRGETDQRLRLLSVWREVPFYTDRERAAFAWTEAVTLVSQDHVPDEVYRQAREQFDEAELANLTLAIVAINGWNRFSISFRKSPEPEAANKKSHSPPA
jgi:AhpD family alkylhydroperoxidase